MLTNEVFGVTVPYSPNEQTGYKIPETDRQAQMSHVFATFRAHFYFHETNRGSFITSYITNLYCF